MKAYCPRAWEHCPNCDAPLGKKIFVGDEWACAACGESGRRAPGQYDTAPLTRYAAWDWDMLESIQESADDELPF